MSLKTRAVETFLAEERRRNSIPTWSMSSETKIHPYVGRESNSIVTRSNSLEMSKHPQVGVDRNSTPTTRLMS